MSLSSCHREIPRCLFDRDSGPGVVPGMASQAFSAVTSTSTKRYSPPCSGSSRNAVRNHPGIAFTLDRNPQPVRLQCEIESYRRFDLTTGAARERNIESSVDGRADNTVSIG